LKGVVAVPYHLAGARHVVEGQALEGPGGVLADLGVVKPTLFAAAR